MKEPVVELNQVQLKADRGGYVFRDLNLTIENGESIVITGPSGSGKTMLAQMLVGLRFASGGTVKLFGNEIKPRKKRLIRKTRRMIGGVGGSFGLLPLFTVAENITLPLVIGAERKKLVKERLVRVLSEFSLLKLANKYPRHLTRVEDYLAQFARAAVANQPLIIIDEPLAGLDKKNYERISNFLVKVALSGRSMLILVSEPPTREIPNSRVLRFTNGGVE